MVCLVRLLSVHETNNLFQQKDFKFTNFNTGDLIPNISLMISGISSICMETISLGKPLVIVQKDKCLNFNPIPKDVSKNIFKETSNATDLVSYINYFINLDKNNKNNIIDEGQNIKNKYFNKPDKKNINYMLNI